MLAFWLLLHLFVESAAAGIPQVYDGGQWVKYDEDFAPGDLRPYPPVSDSWKRDDTTILVSISSFRDYRCPKTLENLFHKAAFPDRVFVGVVQQNSKDDADCLYDYCVKIKMAQNITPVATASSKREVILENCPHANQIRMLRVDSDDAKGPTYGRYLSSKLLGDEEFCMQIDAHMDFLYNWDTILLKMWGMVRNEYGVLSTYVPRLEEMGLNANERWEVPHICRVFFTPGEHMPRNEQAKAAMWLTRPKMTTTWGAGFAFNKCHAERRVPYDPHLPSLFDGEEFSKFARLWTKGYDVYTPHRSVVYHDYNHGVNTAKASSWSRKIIELKMSHDRLRILFGMPQASVDRNSSKAHEVLGKWDLGTKRTLDQLIEFTGADTRKLEVFKSSCQRLQWVPFDPEGEGDGDPMTAVPFQPDMAMMARNGATVSAKGPLGLDPESTVVYVWVCMGGFLLLLIMYASARQGKRGDYEGRALDV